MIEDILLSNNYTYEWKRDDVVIVGETIETYTLVDEDVADRITVTATYTDTDNVEQSATSNPVGPVVSPNAATGNPKISGLGQVGSTLTAVPGDIADVDGGGLTSATEYSYTWFHGDDDDYSNPLGSGPTYILRRSDVTTRSRLWPALWMDWGIPTLDPARRLPRSLVRWARFHGSNRVSVD